MRLKQAEIASGSTSPRTFSGVIPESDHTHEKAAEYEDYSEKTLSTTTRVVAGGLAAAGTALTGYDV